MNKKILIITTSYPRNPGDSEAAAGLFVRDLALELKKLGHSVFVLTVSSPGNFVDEDGIAVFRFGHRLLRKPLSQHKIRRPVEALKILFVAFLGLFHALRLSLRIKPSLTLALWALPSGFWALAAKLFCSQKYVTWSLGSEIWEYGQLPVFRSLLKWVCRHSEKNYADGFQLSQAVEQLTQKSCEFLASARSHSEQTYKASQQLPGRVKKRFLFVGRYHPNKGPDLLLEAILLLPKYLKNDIEFHFFGIGPMKKHLDQTLVKKQIIEDFVKVHGILKSDSVSAVLNSADFLVIPSRIESIPCILGDAAQQGIPPIVCDVGDMGKIVGEYDAGIVCERSDAASIRDGLLKAISTDPGIFKPGLEKLKNLLSIHESAKKLSELSKEFS